MALNRGLMVLFPALTLAAFGCNGSSSGAGDNPTGTTSAPEVKASATPPATASASASASAAAAKRPPMHHGGLTGWLFSAAEDLKDLKDDQETKLDALEKTLHADESSHTEMKDFHSELKDEVKAGKIDNAKLEPKYAAIDAAMKARQDKDGASMTTLHDILTKDQRKEVTDGIRAKQKDMEEKMKAHEGDHKPEDMQKRKLDRMTKELGLDADQAKKVDMGPQGKKAREPMEKEVAFLNGLLPILKPDQKDKLVAKMEHPQMRPGMHPGMGGMEHEGSLFDDPSEGMGPGGPGAPPGAAAAPKLAAEIEESAEGPSRIAALSAFRIVSK